LRYQQNTTKSYLRRPPPSDPPSYNRYQPWQALGPRPSEGQSSRLRLLRSSSSMAASCLATMLVSQIVIYGDCGWDFWARRHSPSDRRRHAKFSVRRYIAKL
ncbi:unnamed protein product, partial [Linum tenue]